MDIVSTQCTLFKRIPKKLDCSFLVTRQFGITTPIQQRRKNTSTTSPNYTRHHTQFEKRYEDKGVNCDMFENIQIKNTATPKLDYEYTKMFKREMRVLQKRDHGLTVFKPVPSQRNRTLQIQNHNLDQSSRKRKKQQRTIMDTDLMRNSVEKEKLFSDRNCRVFLNDLWCDSYRE